MKPKVQPRRFKKAGKLQKMSSSSLVERPPELPPLAELGKPFGAYSLPQAAPFWM